MWEIEAIAAVRGFIETGGDVLLVIAFVTAMMWTLILERMWYFRFGHRDAKQKTEAFWNARDDHRSWSAHKIRDLLISRMELNLTDSLAFIRTLVAVCRPQAQLGRDNDPLGTRTHSSEHFVSSREHRVLRD